MRTIIADDEHLARARLRRLLEEIPEIEIVGEADSGGEVLELTARLRPDLLLLDVRMPEIDGIEVAKALSVLDPPPAIIFTTAYDSHALQAFETHAVAYLLKPIRKANLEQALEKAGTANRAQIKTAETRANQPRRRTHLSVRSSGRVELIPIEGIYYFQAEHKYVKIRHRNGESLTEETLKSLEEEFPEKFIRIHRNALVASKYLARIEKDTQGKYAARIRDINETLDISRRHLPAVRRAMKKLETQV